MIVETAAVPPFLKNGFVIGCPRTREAVCIDPGDELSELVDAARRQRLTVTAILLTHAHVDHVAGVAAAKRAWDVPIWVHRDDLFLYDRAVAHGSLFGLRIEAPPPPDRFYQDEQVLTIGDYAITWHHTPGHCPGGVCLTVRGGGEPVPDLFVGDTLFAGSIGRTDLPGGDYDTLMRSITTVLYPFGDEARVRPGHGPDTTIGAERRTNPFLLEWDRRHA